MSQTPSNPIPVILITERNHCAGVLSKKYVYLNSKYKCATFGMQFGRNWASLVCTLNSSGYWPTKWVTKKPPCEPPKSTALDEFKLGNRSRHSWKAWKQSLTSWSPTFPKEGKNFKFSGHFDSWDTSPKVKLSRYNVFKMKI